MNQSTLSVVTRGLLCPSPSKPLSLVTRGLLCFILIVEIEDDQRGGGTSRRRGPRFGDYKFSKADLKRIEEQRRLGEQIAREDEDMVSLIMLSMIYRMLD